MATKKSSTPAPKPDVPAIVPEADAPSAADTPERVITLTKSQFLDVHNALIQITGIAEAMARLEFADFPLGFEADGASHFAYAARLKVLGEAIYNACVGDGQEEDWQALDEALHHHV